MKRLLFAILLCSALTHPEKVQEMKTRMEKLLKDAVHSGESKGDKTSRVPK